MGKHHFKKAKSNFVTSLELPKDIVYGAAIVTITGKSEILIENYKGIMEYTNERIRLQAKGCRIEVHGKDLGIAYYTNDEMKITGCIHGILYDS